MTMLLPKILGYLFDKQLSNIISILVGLGLFVAIAVRLSNIWVVNPDISGLESTSVIYFLQKHLSGEPIYTDPEAHPFAIAQYTPVYYWITGTVGKIIGTDASEPIEVYRLSRVVSLVGNLLALLCLGCIAAKYFSVAGKYLFWLLALVFLYIEPQQFSRPDSWYQLFFMGAMLPFFAFVRSGFGAYKYLAAAAVLAAVACFTKQAGVLVFAIMASYLLFFRYSWRSLFVYLAAFGASVGLFLLCLADVGIFYKNVVLGLDNGIDVLWYYKYLWSSFLPFIAPIAIVALGVSVARMADATVDVSHFLAYAIITAFVFANVTGLKYGSGPNYFQEFLSLSFLCCIWRVSQSGLLQANTGFGGGPAAANRVPAVALAIAFALLVGLQSSRLVFDFRHVAQEREYTAAREIRDYVEASVENDGRVFVFAKGWVEKSFVINFLANRATMINKDIYGCCSYPRGVYNLEGFKQSIVNGEIQYVVLPIEWQQIDFLGETYSDFETVFTAAPYKVCKLKAN